jgi:prolyl-tRNA editing enzyme YbaK/EbsC (Cys-tRNA(Pro) deacylase)
MTAALSLDALLERRGIGGRTVRSNRAARRPRPRGPAIREERVARTLLLVEGDECALAVVPKDRRLDLAELNREFGRLFRRGRAEETRHLFPDLPLRTLPPGAGRARVEVFLDQSLAGLSEVFFQTGDPVRLVRLDGEAFRGLFYGCWCGRISRRPGGAQG